MYRIVSWNINSVRLRLPQLLRLFKELRPTIVCLQEIKTEKQFFPAEAIAAAGYPHQVVRGMKGYNGVALLSRLPLKPMNHRLWCEKDDARHVAARLADGIELHNFYVPAGGDEPDVALNVKFAHKLKFLEEMQAWSRKGRRGPPRILVGDLNIAPLPEDVWSHEKLKGVISHTPVEVEALTALQRTANWVDSARALNPPPEKIYSWWSYRTPDWELYNRGRRLDHIWLSPDLGDTLKATGVHKAARGWERPSDHAPVWADLKL